MAAAAAAAKTKTAPASTGAPKGGKAAKRKVPTPSPGASGTATPTSEEHTKPLRIPKPDKNAYDAEQEALKTKIAELREKMSAIQNKISTGSNAGSSAERRTELRAEMDKIFKEQGKFKTSRGQLITQLKTLNENIAKKIKDLQAAKSKTQFKSVADIDAHIRQLEKQVESGTMKLVDEKRALAEISSCKRLRRTVENFQADQDIIDRDRAQVEEIRKQLDDPENKALSDRVQEIKAELDQIKKEGEELYANRNKLYDERNELKVQLDELHNKKRESVQRFREESDHYWQQVHEDRARRADHARKQRQAEEEAKRKEVASRMREEAALPAYQAEIEDCQTLIEYLSGKTTGAIRLSTSEQAIEKNEVEGVPKLEIRQVESNTDGLVVHKKKGDDDEAYFVGGKGKKSKKTRGGAKTTPNASGDGDATPTPTSPSGALNIPLPTLSALLSLSIPPPASSADIPRAIEDLKTKKAWFEANQQRVTQENIAKAEAEIQRLLGDKNSTDGGVDTPPKGVGENPPDPAPTPADTAELERAVSPEEVGAELEEEITKGEIEVGA